VDCYVVYGLHRVGALRQVMPVRPIMGPDNILLSELAFLGTFAAVPERMFYYRMTDNVGDLPSYFRRLNLHLTPWRAAALYGAYARAYLAMAWRRSRAGSERVCLVASTLLRLAKGACGFFGSLAFLACFPRTYARVMRWLVRRHRGQEWHERKGSDGAAVQ
jgi:hypothetical protein